MGLFESMKINLLYYLFFVSILPNQINVNIFIHGTIKPFLKARNIATILGQDVLNTPYASFNKFMRKSDYLKKYQAVQELGLKKIDLDKMEPGNGAAAIANLYSFFEDAPSIFYTFGWSGLLSYKIREETALDLYNQIDQLVNELKNEGYNPKINLITYSHGGTVALNIGKVAPPNQHKINLITLGMPVQKDTDHLCDSPIFENIYHFYSTSDYVQPIDHTSSEFFSCHRKFHTRKDFVVPNKLKQIKIGVIKTALNTKKHNKKCPPESLIKKGYHQNPGHSELWILGWSASGYRKDYPLYPMPIVVFTPLLTRYIDKFNAITDMAIDINPLQEEIVVSDLRSGTSETEPFITYEQFQALKSEFLRFFTPNVDLKDLKQKTRKAAQKYAFFKHDPCNKLNYCPDRNQQ